MTEQYAPSWFDVRDEAQHVTAWTADELDRMVDQVRAEAHDQGYRQAIRDATGEEYTGYVSSQYRDEKEQDQ